MEVVCTHTAEVEEGVCVPFAVHANLTLNM